METAATKTKASTAILNIFMLSEFLKCEIIEINKSQEKTCLYFLL